MRLNHRDVLICVSLMTKDVEYFFRCFSAIQVSIVEKSLSISVPHFLIGLFGSLESNFLIFLCFTNCVFGVLFEKLLKKGSKSLVIREMLIKMSLRFHLTPIRMDKMKTSGDNICW